MAKNNKTVANVPNLRFPNFKGDWKTDKMGEISQFSKGKGISKLDIVENGTTECIRYGELYTHYSEIIDEVLSTTNIEKSKLIISTENDVIIPSSGETPLDIAKASCVIKSGIALGGDLNIIKTDINGVFLSYYLNSKKRNEIASLAQGSSVVHLYSKQLSKLNIYTPLENEQNKLAYFLTTIDKRISTQNKIIEDYQLLKKGTMQKLFKQKLRFKDRKGALYSEWEKKKMSQIAIFFSGGTPKSSNTHFYNGDIPFIGSGDISKEKVENFITKQAYKNSSAKMVEGGDILYALYGATSGEVALSKIKGAINQAVLCIKTEEVKYFIVELLKYNKSKIVSKYLQGGQGNLSAKIVKDLKFYIPSVSEQQKIANTLSAIDAKIALETKLLEQHKSQKKYLLQNLFI
ncbi:restriction endonuclease subunit S [Wenyingzhuangia marina]|uniref:Type I restriction enzyme, S subunit n=1 Tax=Wenyingzhuangia marina TaxID=1195760 RepID=A0A1M5VCW7_9FLAO|nr:restriction endonuclease subunit S [Wenyingzhuangia marina]GGF72936.1 hypothetical protein GCM10011397_14820 [Wenyingzhuangia marina]SHH73067.1 type I restriction enzyme, S subunit [Wenyingzhuangia marina]